MIKGLNHVAIAVPDLAEAAASYEALGAKVSEPQDLPEHGVTVVFITLDNTKIELLHPLGEASPIAGFLDKNPSGGIHHLCFEVEDIADASARLGECGIRVLGDREHVPAALLAPLDLLRALGLHHQAQRPSS